MIYGVLIVDGMGVNCEGFVCLSFMNYVVEVVIFGVSSMVDVFVFVLVEVFVLRNGYLIFCDVFNDNFVFYELNN